MDAPSVTALKEQPSLSLLSFGRRGSVLESRLRPAFKCDMPEVILAET